MAGGRKLAQPSIPEGILSFPPPDPTPYRTREAISIRLKTKAFRNHLRCKKSKPPGKFLRRKTFGTAFALVRVKNPFDNRVAALTASAALAMFDDYSGRNLPSVRCPRP